MQIKARNMKIGDILTEDTTVLALTRTGGHTFAKLDDDRQLVCVDAYLLDVRRAPKEKGPELALRTLVDVVPQKRR
jgi:hypothetical protein